MKTTMISPDEIDRARWIAATPRKKVDELTAALFESVADARAARKIGQHPAASWSHIRGVLDHAAAAGRWDVLDAFADAWVMGGLSVSGVIIIGGTRHAAGEWTRQPIRRRTLEVINAIDEIQENTGTLPAREALRQRLKCKMTELVPVLKKLGWAERIR